MKKFLMIVGFFLITALAIGILVDLFLVGVHMLVLILRYFLLPVILLTVGVILLQKIRSK